MATEATARKTAGADPIHADSKHYKVEFEDDRVRVLRISYGPKEKSVMHGHPSMIGVMITDAHIRFTFPDGKVEEIEGKAGQVLSFPPHEHLPENLADQPFEAIAVELKG